MNKLITAVILCMLPFAVHAETRVFACEAEWAALADEIGGDLVDSFSATTALQDPH